MIEKPLAIQDIVKIAKQVLIETGKHSPQMVYENGLGGYEIALLLFETDEEKERMLKKVRQIIQEKKVERYFIINEAWTLRTKGKPKNFVRPSKSANRRH